MLRVRHLTGKARFVVLGLAALALLAGVSLAHPPTALSASVSCPDGTTLDVIAHEDDSLLFMSPDLLHDITNGRCVRTVVVTAGDAGLGESYWSSRETGVIAAYANMAGVSKDVTESFLTLSGQRILVDTLSAAPEISLIFLRLPDGNLDGTGFTSHNNQSLQQLYTGKISQIDAVDGSATYTRSSLTTVLTSLMNEYLPDRIDTQDFIGSYGGGDHSDHLTVAYLARDAHRFYAAVPHTLVGYLDYGTAMQPANVLGSDFTQKDAAWLAYAGNDSQVCQTDAQCFGTNTWAWLSAQYTVGEEAGGPGVAYSPTANAGPDQTVLPGDNLQLDGSASSDPGSSPTYQWTQTAGPAVALSSSTAIRPTFTAPSAAATLKFQLVVTDGEFSSQASVVTITVIAADSNLAPYAAVTASSEDEQTGQLATKAVDGVIDGWPGDATREWATVGGGAGSWLKLSWTSAHSIAKVILYDRPNGLDQITSATLTFSDGSAVHVGALNDDGTGTTVTFPAVTTTSVLLTVDSVSASTRETGLAEIQIYAPGTTDMTPKANAGPAQTVPVGSTVQLDGSASNDPGGSPSYQWTQTAGPAVTLSSGTAVNPTFTAPGIGTTLSFQLVVSDNHLADQATVTITVDDPNGLPSPVVATGTATGVGATSATVHGVVNPESTDTAYHFEYGTSMSYGLLAPQPDGDVGSDMTDHALAQTLSGLQPNATYHFRIVATSQAGSTYGSDQTFTTPAVPPVVSTEPATAVGPRSATLRGTVSPGNSATTYHFDYGTSTGYGQTAPVPDGRAGSDNTQHELSEARLGLEPNKRYHFRIVATNQAGTTYGDDRTFLTATAPPTVATGRAGRIGQTTAVLTATVNPNGSTTSYHFEWGKTNRYGRTVPLRDANAGADLTEHAVSQPISGLSPNTTYHYRIVAANPAGATHGQDRSFKTLGPAPRPKITTTKPRATKNGELTVTLRCSGASCKGILTVKITITKNRKRTTITLGTKKFTIAAGKTATIKIKVSKRNLALLKSKPKLAVKATLRPR